jgi:hypothetical protein
VRNINRCTISIQDIKKYFKKEGHLGEPIEKAQP